MKTESVVKERYAAAAQQSEAALCCPVEYDPQYLRVIPNEVIEKDYGCGDPSKWLQAGETVLDLGSGTGKICFIASQVVGAEGHVIGVDMTDAMLDVARRNAPVVAEAVGYSNVDFRKGRIQDLALDLALLENYLERHPIHNANDWMAVEAKAQELRETQPLVADESVDVVVSNCVLNLVEPAQKEQMFREIYRVLKEGGRAVISDIVADEEVPQHMQKNAHLWSGCISGAMTETAFLKAFEDAGFYGVEFVKFESDPWQTVEGIEFRSVTVQAWKAKQGVSLERNQAVIYNGPFKKVLDDHGHAMERGKRYAVCDNTYQRYQKPPYAGHFTYLEPLQEIAYAEAQPFDCSLTELRSPRETKGSDYQRTTDSRSCCEGDSCC